MHAEKLQKLLENIINEMEDVDFISVVDKDGLPIASVSSSVEEGDIDKLGALGASFDTFIERVKKEFSGKEFINITVMDNKKFLFAGCGDDIILIFRGKADAKEGRMKVMANFATERIGRIIAEDMNVTVEIPKIVKILSEFDDGKLPSGNFSSKIIVCGDFAVGKTSLVKRFVDNTFSKNYIPTLGVDISRKSIVLDKNCTVDFIIWDISGQKKQMEPYRKRFYSGANCAFLVFDKTRKETFESLDYWLEDLEKEVGSDIPKIIIGNKNDLIYDFQVTTDELKEYADKKGIDFIETSAKTGENVENAFRFMAYKHVSTVK